jgi:hypothetical protein
MTTDESEMEQTKRAPRARKNSGKTAKQFPENRQFKPKRRGGNPNPHPPPVEHQFKPGQSGNPGGRPKILGEAYREWLAKYDEETGLTRAQGVAMAMGKSALGGKVDAAREIRAATEAARVEVTGADGKPLLPATAKEMTDEQLAAIAAGGIASASGDGTVTTPQGAP